MFERVLYDQIEFYLDDKKLPNKFQFGFRTCYLRDTCLIHLTVFLKFQMGRGTLVGMGLLDLQKR